MNDKVIKSTVMSLTTSMKEVLNDVVIPSALNEVDQNIISHAMALVGNEIGERKHVYSIFNSLNGNTDNKFYAVKHLINDDKINYPTDNDSEDDNDLREYATKKINEYLDQMQLTEVWVSDYLELLENVATYLPSKTGGKDISLFDQAKLNSAIASCLVVDSNDREISSWDEDELFILYSMDFSGIQDFIYTINSEGALKTLRAKSFYLEVLMENIVDDLLMRLGLTRANLIYSGGGHCYMLLPNTEETICELKDYNKQINDWLLDLFNVSLYVAQGFCKCSNNRLRNIPEGSYSELFKTISKEISAQKSNRYSAEEIIKLNARTHLDYSRECKICKRIDRLNDENECYICSAIKDFSRNILKDNSFVIIEGDGKGLPMPFGRQLIPADLGSSEGKAVRSYHKRKKGVPDIDSTPLFVGDYASHCSNFEEMAKAAEKLGRIKRIGILRADVDNLGTAFSCGFDKSGGGSLMKTAALSRQLSLFFKHHINTILAEKNRNATICYSGGDDLFIVGEWYDTIELSMDIRRAFDKYTLSTLSISAGIGICDSSYPVKRMAYETADMEEMSKQTPGKNAITVFENNTYKWDVFENEVFGEKLSVISQFFAGNDDRGMSFLYKLLELIRGRPEKINFARYVYLLSRLEPSKDDEKYNRYKEFANHMYEWIKSEEDSKQLCTAIMLFVYLTRKKEE